MQLKVVSSNNQPKSIIAEKTKNEDTFKTIKVIREFFNHLSDPDFPYFAKLLLLTGLTHMNSKLDDKTIDASLVLNQKGVLKISTEKFREEYKEHKKAFDSIGFSCSLIGKDNNGVNKTGTVKKIVFSFTREAKEKYLTSRSYAYLRADYVTWFKTIVTKYLKNSDSVSSFFTLSILLSYWNTTEIINLDIKKLAVSIGLKSMIKNRRQTLIKTTITKYLEYLKQEGLIENSEIVKVTQKRIKLLNINAKKKEARLQQKEKASKEQIKTPKASKEQIKTTEPSTKQVKTPKASTKQVKTLNQSTKQVKTTEPSTKQIKTPKASKEQVKTIQTANPVKPLSIIEIKKFINPVPPKNVSTPKRNLVLTATKKPKIIGLNPK